MDLNLHDQVAFVAGSSRGIGRAIAETLLAEGARVVVTGRDPQALRLTVEAVETSGNRERLLAISGDLSDASVIASAFQRTVARFGRIDHMVANLGTGTGESGWDLADSEWQRLLEQNFFAATRLTQEVLPHLFANDNGGSVLYISSIVAIEASAAPLPYSAAKAALLNYSKNLARRLGGKNIRVNSICPGNVRFPGGSWQRRLDQDTDGVNAMLKSEVPQQRFGSPAEIASLAAYLCSAQASFITGSCYVVDGGQTRNV
jgi:3-oxoacyl-[acyl-carrier protein] reductase